MICKQFPHSLKGESGYRRVAVDRVYASHQARELQPEFLLNALRPHFNRLFQIERLARRGLFHSQNFLGGVRHGIVGRNTGPLAEVTLVTAIVFHMSRPRLVGRGWGSAVDCIVKMVRN